MPLFCVEYMLPRVATKKVKKLEEPQYRSRGAPIFGVSPFQHVLNTDLLLRIRSQGALQNGRGPVAAFGLLRGGRSFRQQSVPFFRWVLKRSQKESYHFEEPLKVLTGVGTLFFSGLKEPEKGRSMFRPLPLRGTNIRHPDSPAVFGLLGTWPIINSAIGFVNGALCLETLIYSHAPKGFAPVPAKGDYASVSFLQVPC